MTDAEWKPIRPLAFLADDNAVILCLVAERLERLGFDVETASTGTEAERVLLRSDASRFALVVLDNRMPGMQGCDLVPWVRARYSDMPIVMHSGDGECSYAARVARDHGAVFLPKPASDAETRQAIEAAGCPVVVVV